MKKGVGCIIVLMLTFMLIGQSAFSQEKESQPHYFVVVTWKAVMPDGGSFAERDSLMQLYVDAIKSNEKVLSVKHMTHYYGDDSHDYLTISEYANWADIKDADKIDSELFKKRLPDKKERSEFWSALGKYFDGHSDEIFIGKPNIGK
ncbi:MAG: hypothetical protein PF517_17730 [Salinivirgaceae bacterium]|nr:hypothetical protein [Salinivirgaceae bacterium]